MNNKGILKRVEDLTKFLDSYHPTEEFDSIAFKILIDEITVKNRIELTFKFKIGITKTIVVAIK